MSGSILTVLEPAYEIAKTVAGAASVVSLGESVAKRVGVLGKDKTVLGEATHFVLDVAGVPKDSALRPAQRTQAPLATPAAPTVSVVVGGAEPRAVCPSCIEGPILAGAVGEEIVPVPCDAHQEEMRRSAFGLGALVDGYENALNLGQSVCGPKPKVKTKKVHPKFPAMPDWTTYYKELNTYKDCLAAEKAQKDAQQKQLDAASASATEAEKKARAAKKMSQLALARKSAQYQKEIDALSAKHAAEMDALKQAEIQKQIDEANQKKAVAEALAIELQAKQKDEAFSAKIAALEATIANQAKQPNGMDQLLQMILLQQLQHQPAQAAVQSAMPFSPAPPGTMVAPPVVPWAPAPGMLPDPYMAQMSPSPHDLASPYGPSPYGSPYDFVSYFGADENAPLDPDLAAEFGVEGGGLTVGQGFELFDLTQAGNLEADQIGDLAEMFAAENMQGSGCVSGGCGIR